MTVMDFPRLLSTNEAAAVMGFKPQTLAKWRANGNPQGPPFVKLGRTVKYRADQLREWLESGRRGGDGGRA